MIFAMIMIAIIMIKLMAEISQLFEVRGNPFNHNHNHIHIKFLRTTQTKNCVYN